MATWFLCKIRYTKEVEPDKFKTINEAYLLDAVSYTEAEARLHEVLADNFPDFQLTNLSRMRLAEVFFVENGPEPWFKVKVIFTSYDEQTQKEKKVPHLMLINADGPREAFDGVVERLGQVDDYTITDINLTPILDVFPYESESPRRLVPLAEATAAPAEA
jgi:hypothetical protein